MSLTHEEKEDLSDIIEIIYGYDSQMLSLKSNYTESTVDAVEEALVTLIECNSSMKELVVNLLGGVKFMAKGWLKRIMGQLRKHLDNEKIKFNGLGCRNMTRGNWRSAIIISTY